ncbi:MAG: phosphate acyltransferase PlsX [Deltaproteobacteria bacterium]|jgi:glycerol-3-phosphate acyltransferase PlsX|nr:phosphate acyltransferase PlsX [Deltaproteobacteria bacterium]
MGGDFGPPVTVPGVLQAARECGCKILLIGHAAEIEKALKTEDSSGLSYEIIHAPDVVLMTDKPSDVLRRKKDSPVQVACRLVREGRADGMLSPGHSGATVACAMFIIGRINGVDRLALASMLPSEKEQPTLLLDVGANVDCKPHHLFQFGLMGSAMAGTVLSRIEPRVGILSIGEEEGKGNSLVKDAYDLLKQANNLNFLGNAEGRDIFTGDFDVIVCDGFVGNVALKLAEGLGTSLSRILKKALFSSTASKLGTLLAKGALTRFARIVDYAEYGGAPLLGLRGVSIICHGKSNSRAICSGVKMADAFVRKETNKLLMESISANEELTLYSRATK